MKVMDMVLGVDQIVVSLGSDGICAERQSGKKSSCKMVVNSVTLTVGKQRSETGNKSLKRCGCKYGCAYGTPIFINSNMEKRVPV